MPETSVTNKSTFFEFTPITLTQMDQVEAIRTASGSTLYVYTFASLFSWREAERYSIYISDDAFLIKYGARGENAYLFPCGSLAGKQRMIDALLQHEPPTFYYVSDDDKLFLEGMYPGRFDFTACRNDYPYLYDKDAQIELAGKDYKGLRHKVNQGRAVARAWSSEPLTAENTDRARAITRKWAEGRTADDPTDVPAVEAALDSFSFLPVWGVLFMADGEDIVVRDGGAGEGEGGASGGVVHGCGAREVSVVCRGRGAGLEGVAERWAGGLHRADELLGGLCEVQFVHRRSVAVARPRATDDLRDRSDGERSSPHRVAGQSAGRLRPRGGPCRRCLL